MKIRSHWMWLHLFFGISSKMIWFWPILNKWWISLQGSQSFLPISSPYPFAHTPSPLFYHPKQKWNWRLIIFSDLCRDGWCSGHLMFVWIPAILLSQWHTIAFWIIKPSSCVILVEVLFMVSDFYCGSQRFPTFPLLIFWYLQLTNLPLCGWVGVFESWTCGIG